jgi:Uma2 family endonuclease
LQIVSPSPLHEGVNAALGQMIIILVDEFGMPSYDLGSTTFRRPDLKKGLEPDNCYYFANAHRIRGKAEIDLRVDPPPDLAVETDVTSSSVRRLRIYAAFGVPEVWRFDHKADEVLFLRLNPVGQYDRQPASGQFPGLQSVDATRFALEGLRVEQTAWRRVFRAWVRETLLPR